MQVCVSFAGSERQVNILMWLMQHLSSSFSTASEACDADKALWTNQPIKPSFLSHMGPVFLSEVLLLLTIFGFFFFFLSTSQL